MLQFSAKKKLHSAEGEILLDVSFSLEQGKFLSLYGKSGAGKTTLLRILAGLTTTSQSYITVDGEVWDSTTKNIHKAVQKRSIGFVFQDFALFPNFTVRKNLEYALQKNEQTRFVDEVLELVELQALQHSVPQNLSGGQKQRVALARAIIRKPKILLLDEPLSALDDEMRFKLQDFILRVHRHFNLTTILVSHNLPEIYKLSDKIILLDNGKIQQEGIPGEIFREQKLSSKFKVTGEILEIQKSDIVYIVSVLVGNTLVKVIATEEEIQNFSVGKKVLIASKAFNPIITTI